jgi:hypothetical protein
MKYNRYRVEPFSMRLLNLASSAAVAERRFSASDLIKCAFSIVYGHVSRETFLGLDFRRSPDVDFHDPDRDVDQPSEAEFRGA